MNSSFQTIKYVFHCFKSTSIINRMNFLVSHIYKEGNVCADGLANIGLTLSSLDCSWFTNVPTSLRGEYIRNRLGMPYFRFITFWKGLGLVPLSILYFYFGLYILIRCSLHLFIKKINKWQCLHGKKNIVTTYHEVIVMVGKPTHSCAPYFNIVRVVVDKHYKFSNQTHLGWLEILEFVPSKVWGSIPSGANFGGLSPYRACSDFKRGPRKWAVGLVPSD